MNQVVKSAILMVSVVCALGGAPSWGGPPNPTASDAGDNTAGGTDALVNTVPSSTGNLGFRNTAFGAQALTTNTAGNNNTAVGAFALQSNAEGTNNTGVGPGALFSNTVGNNNTAVGVLALQSNTQGNFNLGVGRHALVSNTEGNNNTAVGDSALLSNSTGNDNTAVGLEALQTSTGSNNIAIGTGAGAKLTSGDQNIYLGHKGVSSESQTMRLGSAQQTRTFIAGITGVPISGAAVTINNKGRLGILASSARYKRDIEAMKSSSQGLYQLRPVTFRYKQDAHGQKQYGLIAEEVAKVYPELVTKGADGKVESVQYHELISMLLNEVQHQQQEITELKAQNERLQAALVQQQAAIAARLERLEAGTGRPATLVSR
jgi:Chaperone of endosialidase